MPEEEENIAKQRQVRTWYVLHVKPRTEKKVFDRLCRMKVFRYLPLREKISRVQRRKVIRHLPLFPGYVFTRLNADERLEALKTNYIVRLIDVTQPRQMIHQLRRIAHVGRLPVDLELIGSFSPGEHVRVKSGPLMGMEGSILRKGNATSLVLELTILGQALAVSVNPADVEKIN